MNSRPKPIKSLIAAIDSNNLIGIDNDRMPWHLPEDLKHFKQVTMGKPVIMGRRTHESIGKPLPGRFNIVLSRNTAGTASTPDLVFAGDLVEAHRLAGAWLERNLPPQEREFFVIGGANVYSQEIVNADRLYLTEIEAAFEGSRWFPPFRQSHRNWKQVSRSEPVIAALPNEFIFSYAVYEPELT